MKDNAVQQVHRSARIAGKPRVYRGMSPALLGIRFSERDFRVDSDNRIKTADNIRHKYLIAFQIKALIRISWPGTTHALHSPTNA
ncbi:hypothetical protein C4K22_5087 [Pseudomonas chlororaphis subsp. aurantiaca]|nr:hypothetical protein JM49_06855 [Pseudomonas chlororaphis subsp. aurantiaca]AZD37807.1 hypothetical protein C4K22_5087 [Pseudomonas chlororaphis subsp. aurantiaca]AZD44147.1 hypothetical protein C4K21_5096 [Pseudomonas chlororaphis subsp. aurantiaca]AZD56707.1 hypothetical protein C4K19_4943 [Pseudomonas chlororaphis subsp. aurantiaca]AZD62689.1 hypothetical protein C4K18_4739 [Pseudomonas chlororaphis subsp. aurantiaca]